MIYNDLKTKINLKVKEGTNERKKHVCWKFKARDLTHWKNITKKPTWSLKGTIFVTCVKILWFFTVNLKVTVVLLTLFLVLEVMTCIVLSSKDQVENMLNVNTIPFCCIIFLL